ncbi:MAG: acetaldehyde dehydrogenase, partial [Pseudonocardiales bacterium]|nr:acetaldehyde dehydrogenase [Pseudonocardiales bacterium]
MALRCAIIGSGNIGTDLMIKLMRSETLELVALVGIDADSDGLARAKALGVQAPHTGIDWIRDHPADVDLVFDATSAYVHVRNAAVLAELGIAAIDLTPAARGPKVVPSVNLTEHLDAPNVNMITCGGQATVPIVAAVSRAAAVPYAEMVSTVASQSAGPGTR